MSDRDITDLFFQRSERAIAEAKAKYGDACRNIAFNILKDKRDAEEILSDTLLVCWNSIPPAHPEMLGAYMYKTARNLSLKRYRDGRRIKRAADVLGRSLDEIDGCLPSEKTVEDQLDSREMSRVINSFLSQLSADGRRIFILRYFSCMKEKDIAVKVGKSVGAVKKSLHNGREKLKQMLKKEGYNYE